MTQHLDLDALQARIDSAANFGFDHVVLNSEILAAVIDRLRKAEAASKWQPIETAPENELVVVMWLDPEDAEHPERYDFDWLEDGCWIQHHENREHFVIAAPPGSRGPGEKAPYTHWKRLAAPDSTPTDSAEGAA